MDVDAVCGSPTNISSGANARNGDLGRHDVKLLRPLREAMVHLEQLRVLKHCPVRVDRLPNYDHREDVVPIIFIRATSVELG